MESNRLTAQDIDWRALCAPSEFGEIGWRVGPTGFSGSGPWVQIVPYLTARAIQGRFDAACGPSNWQNSAPAFYPPNTYQVDEYDERKSQYVTRTRYVPGRVSIGIGIRIDGEWVWKYDGANETNVEPFKGGVSNAEKRAAVQWGVGRDLYDDRFKRVYADVLPNKNGSYDRAWVRDKKDKANSRHVFWKLPARFVPGSPQDPDPNIGDQQPPPPAQQPANTSNGSNEPDATDDVRKDFADQALEILAASGLKAGGKWSTAMMDKVNAARKGSELRQIIADIKSGLQAGAKARTDARNAAEPDKDAGSAGHSGDDDDDQFDDDIPF